MTWLGFAALVTHHEFSNRWNYLCASSVYSNEPHFSMASFDDLSEASSRSASAVRTLATNVELCLPARAANDAMGTAPARSSSGGWMQPAVRILDLAVLRESEHDAQLVPEPSEIDRAVAKVYRCGPSIADWRTVLSAEQARRERSASEHRQRAALMFSGIGFSIPILLLALGHALAWAIRGLRPDPR